MAPLERLPDWAAVGARVAQARHALKLSQADLGVRIGLGRTAIARIEGGNRTLSALELTDLARATDLPVDWFVTESPPVVASHRADRPGETTFADLRVETLEREVAQLRESGLLRPVGNGLELQRVPRNVEEAENVALLVRAHLGCETDGPIDLGAAATDLNLYAYTLDLRGDHVDGAYVVIDEGTGVALIDGRNPSARRRFTLAHEIGHHVFQDEYALDSYLDTDTERIVSAFAIHLLLPREVLERQWNEIGGPADHRKAAIVIGAEYRVSWTALCTHLVNMDLLERNAGEALRQNPPRRAEYIEHGVSIAEELTPPSVPLPVQQAVLRGYRRHRLGAERTIALLHGTISEEELPDREEIPLGALAGELRGAAW